MHPQTKRLKFNILLTTYEILLKDKVITLLQGDKNNLSSVELSLDLHVFGLCVIKFMESEIAFAFGSMTVRGLGFGGSFVWGIFFNAFIFSVCVVRLSAFFHFIKRVTLLFLQFAWDSRYCNNLPSSRALLLCRPPSRNWKRTQPLAPNMIRNSEIPYSFSLCI